MATQDFTTLKMVIDEVWIKAGGPPIRPSWVLFAEDLAFDHA
jgi:hypothetical protein